MKRHPAPERHVLRIVERTRYSSGLVHTIAVRQQRGGVGRRSGTYRFIAALALHGTLYADSPTGGTVRVPR